MESPTRTVSIEACLNDLCMERTLPHYFIVVEEGGKIVRSRPIFSHKGELDRALFDGLRFEHFSLDMAGNLRSQFNALKLPEIAKGRCLEYFLESTILAIGDDDTIELPVRVPITRRIA